MSFDVNPGRTDVLEHSIQLQDPQHMCIQELVKLKKKPMTMKNMVTIEHRIREAVQWLLSRRRMGHCSWSLTSGGTVQSSNSVHTHGLTLMSRWSGLAVPSLLSSFR